MVKKCLGLMLIILCVNCFAEEQAFEKDTGPFALQFKIINFIDYIHYFSEKRFSPYFGFGVSGGILFSKQNENEISGGDYRRTRKTMGWSTGFSTIFGCEWWFHNKFSLCLEYQVRYVYTFINYSDTEENNPLDITTISRKMHDWSISPYQIDLGFTAYF